DGSGAVAVTPRTAFAGGMSRGWKTESGRVMAAQDARCFAQSKFVMNTKDALAYAEEIGLHVTGKADLADVMHLNFLGKKIVPNPYFPPGHILFTPLKNLVFGVNNVIRRDRFYHTVKRVLQYVFDWQIDYGIAVYKAVVLGMPKKA
ncbi:MAG: hypothetical protein GY862_36815, partial [Gammaproteobacteria bacterium]|nr:hypothetical protein [Gammaproteobacteria bacterium]